MKNLLKSVLLFFVSAALVTGCESDDPVGGATNSGGSTGGGDMSEISFSGLTTDSLSKSTFTKNVLIEKITAVNCPNCPSTTTSINTAEANNTDRIVAVKYHYGSLANTTPDYRTSQGDDIVSISLDHSGGQPLVAFNRNIDGSRFLNSYSTTNLNNALADTTSIYLDAISSIENDSISISFEYFNKEDITGTEGWRYFVFITESNIIGRQSGASNTYNHTDMFRASITSQFGEPLTTALEANTLYTYDSKIAVDSSWDTSNIKGVVFVGQANGAVKQVIEFPIL